VGLKAQATTITSRAGVNRAMRGPQLQNEKGEGCNERGALCERPSFCEI